MSEARRATLATDVAELMTDASAVAPVAVQLRARRDLTARWLGAMLGALGVGILWAVEHCVSSPADFYCQKSIWFALKVGDRIEENFHTLVASPVNPADRFYWVYLLLFVVFGVIAYVLYYARSDEANHLAAFFKLLFPKDTYLHPSAKVDYAILILNRVFTPALLITRLISATWLTVIVAEAMAMAIGPREPTTISSWIGILLFTLAASLVTDFTYYLGHALSHRVPLLWEFHKLHHSAEVLTPFTVDRVHPVEHIVGTIVTVPIAAAFSGVAAYFILEQPTLVTIFGASAINVLFWGAGHHLRHSHIWLAWPRAVSHILISPAQHQIHHSVAPQHWDRNYGFIFALWDWMFGTLYVPRSKETLTFGLGQTDRQIHPTVWAAYVSPFAGAWSVISRRRAPQSIAAAAERQI